MKTRTTLIVLAGIGGGVGLAYVGVMASLGAFDLWTGILTLIFFIAILMGFALLTRPGGRFTQDERVRKLWLRASNLSWGLTVFGVSILISLNQLKVFSMTYAQLLSALVMFMPYSMLIIRLILGRFGEKSE